MALAGRVSHNTPTYAMTQKHNIRETRYSKDAQSQHKRNNVDSRFRGLPCAPGTNRSRWRCPAWPSVAPRCASSPGACTDGCVCIGEDRGPFRNRPPSRCGLQRPYKSGALCVVGLLVVARVSFDAHSGLAVLPNHRIPPAPSPSREPSVNVVGPSRAFSASALTSASSFCSCSESRVSGSSSRTVLSVLPA